MKKDTYYFSHDYNARLDDKIKQLIRKHSMLGYGCYWAIIEDLYNNANALRLDYDGIAFDLRITIEQAKSIINDFDLFVIDGDQFGSMSVERRLNERNEKSIKASQSANLRWQKTKQDANALPPQSDSNAIKEKKENEIKEKENNILERKLKFADTLKPFLETYGKEMIRKFYDYWTEPNKSNTKFKMELEKTWSLERRLETWASMEKEFIKDKPQPINNYPKLK